MSGFDHYHPIINTVVSLSTVSQPSFISIQAALDYATHVFVSSGVDDVENANYGKHRSCITLE